jgi:hypothetical protein
MISSALGLPYTPHSFVNWLHGWCFSNLEYIEQFGFTNDFLYLVATKEEELFFKRNYKSALAVGAPYTYAEKFDSCKIRREPNSLLVMPPHGLPFSHENWSEESYVEKISNLKSDFDHIVACIHSSCIDKNKWVEQLDNYGIPWIVGADMHDRNALVRMHRLFSSFEYMTTNSIGSHIAYAAYSGCKVSIYGDFLEWGEEDVKDDDLYVKYPHVMHHNLCQSSRDSIFDKFPFLFIPPKEASEKREWANDQLGRANHKSYVRLAVLLAWLPSQQLYFWSLKIFFKIKRKLSSWLR